MKQVITPTVVFNPAAKTVKITDIPGVQDGFDVRDLYAIINQTTGQIIYSTASTTLGYTAVTGDTITLAFDTTSMSSTHVLQIIYEVNEQLELTQALYELIDRLAFLAGARGTLADLRVNATGGILNTVSVVSTVSSVINAGNLQQVGGFQATPYLQSIQNISGAQGNINNIDVTIS